MRDSAQQFLDLSPRHAGLPGILVAWGPIYQKLVDTEQPSLASFIRIVVKFDPAHSPQPDGYPLQLQFSPVPVTST